MAPLFRVRSSTLGGGLLCCGSRGDGPPGLTGIGCRDALAWRSLGPGPWCGVCLRGPKGSASKSRLETARRPLLPRCVGSLVAGAAIHGKMRRCWREGSEQRAGQGQRQGERESSPAGRRPWLWCNSKVEQGRGLRSERGELVPEGDLGRADEEQPAAGEDARGFREELSEHSSQARAQGEERHTHTLSLFVAARCVAVLPISRDNHWPHRLAAYLVIPRSSERGITPSRWVAKSLR